MIADFTCATGGTDWEILHLQYIGKAGTDQAVLLFMTKESDGKQQEIRVVLDIDDTKMLSVILSAAAHMAETEQQQCQQKSFAQHSTN